MWMSRLRGRRLLPFHQRQQQLVSRPSTYSLSRGALYLTVMAIPSSSAAAAFAASVRSQSGFGSGSGPSLPYCNSVTGSGVDSTGSSGLELKLDLSHLATHLQVVSDQRQAAYETSRKVQIALLSIRDTVGTPEATETIQTLVSIIRASSSNEVSDMGDTHMNRTPREANLSHVTEDLVRVAAYHHFLSNDSATTTTTAGSLLPPVAWATDEEYLAGAVMGLCQDLSHYGLGRATVRDVASVRAAAHLVTAVHDYLLQLDFRNGPLRRKYDGCKYALKALETLLYELAVTTPSSSTSSSHSTRPDASEQSSLLLPVEELEAIRQRMIVRDELRETLLKLCRDGQKASKQAIFALHRGDTHGAATLLHQCATLIQTQLWPIVQREPALRSGSFAAVVEEYVEAKLFYTWLHGRLTFSSSTPAVAPNSGNTAMIPTNGLILLPHDFEAEIMALEPDEYLGGLCDLTGEIGRYAVQRGTARDVVGVQKCWHSNRSIARELEVMSTLRVLPGNHLSKS